MNYQNKLVLICTLIIAAFALYCYNPFVLYFQNDDFVHIPLSAEGVLLQHNTFRPVCDLSIMLDYFLWGKTAWGYHLTNLLLHIMCSILLFFFLKLILRKYFHLAQTTWVCWLSSLLFFIYAMHSEAVFWILGRSAMLGALFSLLFLFCYIKKYDSKIYVAGSIIFFISSLLSYESAWVLPFICIIIGIAETRINKITVKSEAKYWSLIVGVFILLILIRLHFIHEVIGNYEASALLEGNVAVLAKNFFQLILRSFLPAFSNNAFLIAVFIVIETTILICFLRLKKQERTKALLIFICFLISLLPYCSLGIDTHGTESERFLYFPALILCIFFGVVIHLTQKINTTFKYLLFAALFICHLIVLAGNGNNYRFAGNINKLIVAELQKLHNKKIIYAESVPQAQNGALILRSGLPEIAKSFITDSRIDTVIVCSQRNELKPLRPSYKVEYVNTWEMNCKNIAIQKDSFEQKNATFFRFTDSVLYITK